MSCKAKLLCCAVFGCLLTCLNSWSATPSAVLRLDASLDELISLDAKLETIIERPAESLETFECPTWIRDGAPGYLIFCNVPGNVIYKLTSAGKVEVFLDDIYTGPLSDAHRGSVPGRHMLGANGATVDPQGRIVYASFSAGEIVRVEKDGKRTVLADRFEGNRLNAPNDLVFRSDGALYFTDSRGSSENLDGPGCGEYWMSCGPKARGRVPHLGVYLVKAGKVQLLTKDIAKPNGLTLSRDEKSLYVANSMGTIVRFDVTADGTTANEQVFVDMTAAMKATAKKGRPDGIKVDSKGNIFCSGPGGIWIYSSAGKHLGTILVDQLVSNFAFGDADARTLYITAISSLRAPTLLRIRLRTAGVLP